MIESKNKFFNVNEKLPKQGQKVLVYNYLLEECIGAVFINGKFYEYDHELINITKWAEINDK